MYSELIHTRCRDGIDIMKGNAAISGGSVGGFKTFACSENIADEGFADLPFLDNIRQAKQSYSDPNFMDDAYLYYTPDRGVRYLVNFHPIHFDRTTTIGDYPHRPGNFINQVFLGDFADFYPYETFGNEDVWDAQKRGEAYYYENSPSPLKPRDTLDESIGYINTDDIADFIKDGRREALMNAIAFIISQYSLVPEERKFLVIKDKNSRCIELWIAAIETAFSPRMASGLSFATRLDKFVNVNKYTVNLNGQYQTQINLQSPNQKLRYRAMIVGVDERDKSNIGTAKALANSPFVVLDGISKTLSIKVDISNPYYDYVTAYDEGHTYFCREFLQMIDLNVPTKDAFDLYSAYMKLMSYGSSSLVKDLLSGLSILGSYQLVRTPYLEGLYASIKKCLPTFLKEDAISAFSILNWLEKVSIILGDTAARNGFVETICHSYVDNAYRHPQNKIVEKLWEEIERSSFVESVSSHFVSEKVIDVHSDTLQKYTSLDWLAFSKLFTDCLKHYKRTFPNSATVVLLESVQALYQSRDRKGALQVVSLYKEQNATQINEILLTDAERNVDQTYISFLVQLIVRVSPEIISSENSLLQFYNQLYSRRLEKFFSVVLTYKAQTIVDVREMEKFIEWIVSCGIFKGLDLSAVFFALDKNLVISEKSSGKVSAMIQKYKPQNTVCINSAHIYALDLLNTRKGKEQLTKLFIDLTTQRFPSLEDDLYANKLVAKILGANLSHDIFETIIMSASHSSFYTDKIAREAVKYVGSRQDAVVEALIESFARSESSMFLDSFANELANLKQFEKIMPSLHESVRSRRAQQYLAQIEQRARTQFEENKGHSLFERLFFRGNSNDKESGKRRKK